MKKVFRTILLIALIIAGVVAGYRGIGRSTVSMDSLLTFCTAQNGGTIAAWNDGNSTVIARLKQNGTINGHLKFRTERKDAMYQILGVTAGEKYVYVLRDKVDRYDGTVLGQELMVIDFDDMVSGPPVQDLWLLLPGPVEECGGELELSLIHI